ncbi:MAG: DUF433 domain-containing protein [Micropepsaceae bacterium]
MVEEYDFSNGVRGKFFHGGATLSPPVRGQVNRVYVDPMSDLLSRITVRPEQCHVLPCIRGMRICVSDVLEMLAGGMSHDEILADYPYLERDDIRSALAYAAQEMKHPIVTAPK